MTTPRPKKLLFSNVPDPQGVPSRKVELEGRQSQGQGQGSPGYTELQVTIPVFSVRRLTLNPGACICHRYEWRHAALQEKGNAGEADNREGSERQARRQV